MIDKKTYESYLQGLLAGNSRACLNIVDQLVDVQTPLLVLYGDLFRRSLYQVGGLWEQNRISVATEHLATAITERVLAAVYPKLVATGDRSGRRALVSCGTNEHHQVGARMVADVLESVGWQVRFLGANVPAQDVLQTIDEMRPELLGLSLSMYFNMASFQRLLAAVRHDYPDLEILIGGQAFRWGGAEGVQKAQRVRYVDDLSALAAELKR